MTKLWSPVKPGSDHPRPLGGDCLCLLAGAALPFAFAPYGFSFLSGLCLAGLFWVWMRSPPARAFWRGWLFGLGMFGLGVSWVVHSFQYSHIPLFPAIALTAVFVGFLALFPALFGWLAMRFRSHDDTRQLLLMLPVAWVLSEWGRGTLLTGFTWLQVGYSQVDTPLAGWAPVAGVYAMNWALALTAGLLVWLIGRPRQRWWQSIAVLLALWGGGAMLTMTQWSERSGLSLRVALIQGNISQDRKWKPEYRDSTLALYRDLTAQHWDADLVVWPETALPDTYEELGEYLDDLGRAARENRTDLLIGVPSVHPFPRRLYNSVVSVGTLRALYHKRHLVPFGEYLPLKPLFQPLVDFFGLPVSSFNRGSDEVSVLRVAGQPIGISICYEATFGADIIEALPEATLLVNVSNDAWFGDSKAPHQHLQMARLRARETGRYLLRATNTGVSAIIDPLGGVVSRSNQFETEVIEAVVLPMEGVTPYVEHGNSPMLGLILGLLALVLGLRAFDRSTPAAA